LSTTVTGYVVDRFGEAAGFRSLAAVALLGLLLLVVAMPETQAEATGQEERPSGSRRLRGVSEVGVPPSVTREVEDAG
jgi:hypothetical protein